MTVLFALEEEDAYLTAWTTTPWTLPSNLAVCVGPDIEYVKVKDPSLDKPVYLAAERLGDYLKEDEIEILARMPGKDLVGKRYTPLFPYFAEQADNGAFVVISGDYVTTDSGSGLVHQAPAFGEDDYQAFRAAGLEAFVCPVDMNGVFTDEVTDFAGMQVKDADKHIIRYLKEHGTLYRQDTIQHSYPFCYRSDTPLIYRAIPSWYVRVSEMHEKLINANQQVRWVPDHIKEGRFGNWIAGAMDWSISRNRVWGTPLPIWINDETGNQICVGSVAELAELTGTTVTDLHREHVDPLTFTKDGEPGTYRRISEVLDCWFESGSMPYAQLHYPFENQDVFEAGFPAEFIAEGLDQTRGWFYTLTVLAAALYDKPAFKNVIVNGMVLAEDGKKMSKRLRNYTPPDDLMKSFGADALRLYLINSGLVKAEEQRFTDSGVRDMTRRALLPTYNAFSFLKTYAEIDQWSPDKGRKRGDNVLDRWILSRLQTLKANVAREMEAYRLYNVVPELFAFIEDLTNWYIRLNRTRFWGSGMDDDKLAAYSTLYDTLSELATVIAPFTPFLSEHLYRELASFGGARPAPISVHLCDYPVSDDALVDDALEDAVDRARQVILLGRQKREEAKISLRTPLACLTIVHRDATTLEQIKALEDTIKGELNVQQVRYDTRESDYIELVAKPNFPVLGKRLGKRMKTFAAAIKQLSAEQIGQLQSAGRIELEGESFDTDEIEVLQRARPGTNVVSNRLIAADLDCTLTPELIRGGYAREVQNRIQQTRKEIGLHVADRIEVSYATAGELATALGEHGDFVASQVLATRFESNDGEHEHEATIDGQTFSFSIKKVPGDS